MVAGGDSEWKYSLFSPWFLDPSILPIGKNIPYIACRFRAYRTFWRNLPQSSRCWNLIGAVTVSSKEQSSFTLSLRSISSGWWRMPGHSLLYFHPLLAHHMVLGHFLEKWPISSFLVDMYLFHPSWIRCCSFPLTLIPRHSTTKRCPKGSPALQT